MKFTISKELNQTDALIVPIFANIDVKKQLKHLDNAIVKDIAYVFDTKDFEAKPKQISMFYPQHSDVKRVFVVGLGEEKDFSIKKYKEAVGIATAQAQEKKSETFTYVLPKKLLDEHDATLIARETVVSMHISSYAFDAHKSDKESHATEIKEVAILSDVSVATQQKITKGVEEGNIIGKNINFSRDLGNTPPSIMSPALLAQKAVEIGTQNKNISVKVLADDELKKLGMGCLMGVGQGSKNSPRFIIMEYWGDPSAVAQDKPNKKKKPSVLVGKGITFDSGGLSLKPGDYMCDMKYDMLGAASVMATIKILADLGIKKNIVSLIPTAENMPGGNAYRPDDILTAMNGKTVEILNTDAEGRLILADGLCYAHKYSPKEVIDMATLTGMCVAALGTERVGIFSPEEKMVEGLNAASEKVGELLWRLPLGEEYSEAMKSNIADIKNIGGVNNPRYGTASTAAAFLEFFTKDDKGKPGYPWLHMDIAGVIDNYKGKSWLKPGATGYAIQTVVEYLR